MPAITQSDLDQLMTAHPTLTSEGYGRSTLVPADKEPDLRADLASDLTSVQQAADWIGELGWTSATSDDSPSSYHLKHVMEEATGRYVTNGALIAAALLVGVPVKLDGLNPPIGVSPQSLRTA
ncbi:hypothetical protein ACFQ60_15290 [Streptomyces zhihengii]|uniref:Uncharacterized protein n=1 Tax=Streptomyces zhihengii TaxID=1818004 RepID=A0ABS2UZB2_9ACTN|nr:hypothetical protein [Streptomyces zhihengii]MBM9622227.1 hypothetical protein [Streptomyces zhihengii]